MSGQETDEQLLARIGRNEPAAVRSMVSRKLPRLLGFAARILGDRGDAEDVAQEAFLRIWRQAGKWQAGDARFDTWLHRVTLNLCYDRLRRRRETVMAEPPEQVDPGPAPDHGMWERDRGKTIDEALAALPDRQREAIVLQYYQELSNVDAAAIMEISVEALESLLARARRNLRASLEGLRDD